jgi:hypothetical protein
MARFLIFILALLVPNSGCKQLDCAPGTVEKNGECVPADITTSPATCGPDTKLEGTVCVSTVQCDPNTTTAMTDTSTGLTTCVGTAGGGCACPSMPASGKQNVCGQLYDFETMSPFVASNATGAKCPTPSTATSGPCALAIQAYDAIAFANNPATALPLTIGNSCIDDMGRYAVTDITPPGTNPFVGLGIDDANTANLGSSGVTNAVGISTPSKPNSTTTGFEAYVVTKAVTDGWASSGGPTLATTGIFAMVFRAHCVGMGCTGDPLAEQAGVMMTKNATPIAAANAKYFLVGQTTRDTVDPVATMTGANGTGLNNNASVNDSLAFSGTGGITDTTDCQWENHAGAALTDSMNGGFGIVFIQVFRKINKIGKTCTE